MKALLRFTSVLACSAFLLFAPAGCETVKKVTAAGQVSVSPQVATEIVVDAEKLAIISQDAFDTYLELEKTHRNAYAKISPEFWRFSKFLRERVIDPTQIMPGEPPTRFIPRAQAMLKILRKATYTFEANETPDNRANLMTAYRTLKGAYDDCVRLTSQIKG